MTEIVHAIFHGWWHGFEEGIAICAVVMVIGVKFALNGVGARFRPAQLRSSRRTL